MPDRFEGALKQSFPATFRTFSQKLVPSLIDLDSPIATVADLTRMAQRGSYWLYGEHSNIGAGGDFKGMVNVGDAIDALNLGQLTADLDAFFIDVWVHVTAGSSTGVDGFAGFAPGGINAPGSGFIPSSATEWIPPWIWFKYFKGPSLAYYPDNTYLLEQLGDTSVPTSGGWMNRLSRGGYQINMASDYGLVWAMHATGALATCNVNFLLWVGPKGATPPGMS